MVDDRDVAVVVDQAAQIVADARVVRPDGGQVARRRGERPARRRRRADRNAASSLDAAVVETSFEPLAIVTLPGPVAEALLSVTPPAPSASSCPLFCS